MKIPSAWRKCHDGKFVKIKGPATNPVLMVSSLVVMLALCVSAVDPYDRPTWLLEVLPVLIAYPVLFITSRRFPLTTLLYV